MPAAHHQHIPIDRNVVPDGPRGHVSTTVLLLLLLLLIMTFPFEVRCRRSRWIAGWITPACGRSNHWLSELMYDIFSDTCTFNTEMRGNYFDNRKFCSVGGPTPELGLVR